MDGLINQRITVTARFVNADTVLPFTGNGYEMRLYDKDLLVDDSLGRCKLNARGQAKISFDLEDIKSFDSPFQTSPNLYFILYHNNQKIYKSDVTKNIDLHHRKSTPNEGIILNLGTYVV